MTQKPETRSLKATYPKISSRKVRKGMPDTARLFIHVEAPPRPAAATVTRYVE